MLLLRIVILLKLLFLAGGESNFVQLIGHSYDMAVVATRPVNLAQNVRQSRDYYKIIFVFTIIIGMLFH